MMRKPDIRDFSYLELLQYLERIGQKGFRAKQIFAWLYKKNAQDFNDMTDLPVQFRTRLQEDFSFHQPKVIGHLVSQDQAQKYLFELPDKEHIETAVIPTAKRLTICASTQVGCKFQCHFCASGLKGWVRHLSCGEILSQILYVKKQMADRSLTNIVFMGIGEPLDNYDQVLKAVRIINSSEGMTLAARRITISTCGLIPQIRQLTQEKLQIELAISLHGYDDPSRRLLMPISQRYPFDDLIAACREYVKQTKRQITFEYLLIKGVTCTEKAVAALGRSLKGFDCKMNLIPYNEVAEFAYQSPTSAEIAEFKQALIRLGIHTTIRLPRGRDVAAACGQLRHMTQQSRKTELEP